MRICQVCGCSDVRACPGGCFWFDERTCSRCVGKVYGLAGLIELAWRKWVYDEEFRAAEALGDLSL